MQWNIYLIWKANGSGLLQNLGKRASTLLGSNGKVECGITEFKRAAQSIHEMCERHVARRDAHHGTFYLSGSSVTHGLSQDVPHAGRTLTARSGSPLPAPTPQLAAPSPAGGGRSVPARLMKSPSPSPAQRSPPADPAGERGPDQPGAAFRPRAAPPALTACSPGACCLNVVESETGGTKAPERHCSGSWPAWMA